VLIEFLRFMGTFKTYSALTLITLIVILLPNCKCKNVFGLDCARTKHSFSISILGYPDRDTLKRMDTIWFEVNEPTTLKDAFTGQMVDYSGAENLGTNISFSALSNSGQFTINAAKQFNYLVVAGREIQNLDDTRYRAFLFIEKNGRYIFKLGVIPKDTGLYSILFSNAPSVYRSSDKCTKAVFGLDFNNTNQHYYLNPFYIPGTNPKGGDYYFVVK
jgi:hypothetical protein